MMAPSLTPLYIFINIVCSVSVIFVNKMLVFGVMNFRYSTLLTLIHFLATFAGCLVWLRTGLTTRKSLPLLKVLPLSLACSGSIVFNNLTLLTNSVAVYQMAKIFNTPVIAALEYRLRKKPLSKMTVTSLCLVCLGSGITVFGDVSCTYIGLFYCFMAVVSTSLYTVWGKSKQDELHADTIQLLLYQAPLSAFILLFFIPVLDNTNELRKVEITLPLVWCIAVSCVCAVGVNFAFFLAVGKTSGLAMNVVGYFKTCLVLFFGFFLGASEATSCTVAGTVVCLFGLALYTHSNYLASKPKKEEL